MSREQNTTERRGGVERIRRSRLAPAGAGRADAIAWAWRASLVALTLGGAWWAFAMLRPLPPTIVIEPTPMPRAPKLPPAASDIAERERRLIALRASNFFAADRAMWTIASVQRSEGQSGVERQGLDAIAQAMNQGSGASAAPSKGVGFDAIPVTTGAKAGAMAAKLKEVELRGVYNFSGEPVALIGMTTDPMRPRAHSKRVGETFDDGGWKVVAIDDRNDRVIISRGGENFELRMYDQAPIRKTEQASAGQAAKALTEPRILVRTPDQVRADLEKAGVSAPDIDEMMRLAQQPDPTMPGAQDQSLAAKQPDAAASDQKVAADAKPAPPGPAGLQTILQMMKSSPVGDGDGKQGAPKREKRPKKGAAAPRPGAAS